MRRVLAIVDRDGAYASRLAAYFNERESAGLKATAFTDLETYRKYRKNVMVEILLISEELAADAHGMTEGAKQGMTEGIRPEVTEGVKPGMGCLVMLRLGRGVPAGWGEGELKGGGDVAGFLLDGEFGLGAGAARPHKNIRTALDRGMKILSSTSGLLRMTKTQHLRSRMTGTNTFGIFRMTTPNSFGIFKMTTTNASAILRMTTTNASGSFRMTGAFTFGRLGMTKGIADCLGEDFGLVVAAGAEAGPVEGDGDDQVDVREVRGGGEATAEEGAVVAPGSQVALVLQGARDRPVCALVIEQGGRVGIVHGLGPAVALQDRVEAVRERVVRREPEACVWHVGRTREAQMPLAHAQPASAGQARPRHEQIAEGDYKVNHPHRSIDSSSDCHFTERALPAFSGTAEGTFGALFVPRRVL